MPSFLFRQPVLLVCKWQRGLERYDIYQYDVYIFVYYMIYEFIYCLLWYLSLWGLWLSPKYKMDISKSLCTAKTSSSRLEKLKYFSKPFFFLLETIPLGISLPQGLWFLVQTLFFSIEYLGFDALVLIFQTLIGLYNQTLSVLQRMPEDAFYRKETENLTKNRLQLVEQVILAFSSRTRFMASSHRYSFLNFT